MMKQFQSSWRRSQLAQAGHLACAAFTLLFSVLAMLFVEGQWYLPEHGVMQQALMLSGV
jgi:hypothetical protein